MKLIKTSFQEFARYVNETDKRIVFGVQVQLEEY